MAQQQTQFLDLYRASMKTAVDAMKSTLESAERVQNRQLELLRSAMEENARSASQLSEVKSLDEMIALQTRFAGSQMERAMDFWSGLWRTAGDNQMAMIGQWQSQADQMRDRLRETYHLAVRGAEGAARSAASQVDSASSRIQEASRERKSA